jgi:hypothetical protein
VGSTPSLLSRPARRSSAAAGLALVVLAYYETSTHLWNAGTWVDVAWLAIVVIPGVLALVWLVLPLRDERWVIWAGLAFALLAVVLTLVHADVFANFSRLGAATFIAFWFLGFFDTLGWVVLVSSIIPWVDAYSVWRGPTKVIVTQHREVFTNFSFAFAIPGETSAANLGLPDLLFFSLFLAASARWELRPRLTWLLLTLSFGATLALAVWRDIGGLPALPLLSLAFLVANGDLLWTRVRDDLAEARARKDSAPTEP